MGVIIEQEPITVAKHSSGNLVTIDQVPKGLACECYCPECGNPLIAKKGDKVHHHFSHKSHDNSDIEFDSCGYDFWRSLHLLAFKSLKDKGGFKMPRIVARYREEFLGEEYGGEQVLVPGKFIEFDSIDYGYLTKDQKLKTIIAKYNGGVFLICPLFSKEKDQTFNAYENIARKGKGLIPVILIDMDGIEETIHPKQTEKFAHYVVSRAKRYWSRHGAKVNGFINKIKESAVAEINKATDIYQNLLGQLESKLDMCDFKIYTKNIKGKKTHDHFKDFSLSFLDFDRVEIKNKRHLLFMQRRDKYCIYLTLSTDKIPPPELRSNDRDICIWMSIPDKWRTHDYIGNYKDIKFKYYIPPKFNNKK